ncbi:unnamed protein product [Prorocentrum cordatum]|uniref:Class I SAM-dependent methyltransferase n=1 Tax=Prorocentrum cordatum TaxID=2364126 RepID=A0ABN9TNW4_9DINO|nr:unnamed protein product [Polarella glacialis]
MQPIIASSRQSMQTVEFIVSLTMLHGRRCFYPALRDALGIAVSRLRDLTSLVHNIQLGSVYQDLYSFWDESLDLYKHVLPAWRIAEAAAFFADALTSVRLELDKLHDAEEGGIVVPAVGVPDWHDESGAFSQMNFLHRQFGNGWHLDRGLVAGLVRLWAPPAGAPGEGCHTSVVDFGAGAGHYCDFFNRTGEYCCVPYDGSVHAPEYTGGVVQTLRLDQPVHLGRLFDWVLCLEMAEHIPAESQEAFLGNLRRHARRGLVLSWSTESGGPHQNARPMSEVLGLVEGLGFRLDVEASEALRPQISWLRGAVRVFRLGAA